MKIPVSYHQQRLWFIDHFEKDYLYEGGPIYHNIPLYFNTDKKKSKDQIKSAFVKLIERHDILRTKIVLEEEQIFQSISSIKEVDISAVLIEQTDLKRKSEELRQKSFDFESDYLIKVYFENTEDGVDFLFIIHHILVDRYSLKKIQKEFLDYIDQQDLLLERTLQYRDFSDWQLAMGEEELDSLISYWRSQLKDLKILCFLTDSERVQVHIYKEQHMVLALDRERILSFCDKKGMTPQVLILAAYKAALSQLTGFSDIAIGTLMNLRNELTDSIIGPVENLVVLRSKLDTNKDVLEIYETVNQTWIEAEKHKTMPFDKLVGIINPKKDMSRTALFDILYVYDAYNEDAGIKKQYIEDFHQGLGKYDFNLLVKEQEYTFDFIMTYNDLYFKPSTTDKLLELTKDLLLETLEKDEELLQDIEIF